MFLVNIFCLILHVPVLFHNFIFLSPAGTLDYVGDAITLEMNAEWPTPDADYTPYTNILSAVWPKLRHRNYTYAVVRLTGSDWYRTHITGYNHWSLNDPCNHAQAIYCGHTSKSNEKLLSSENLNK